MEQDLRSMFDIDAFSIAEQLPNLSVLDATAPSFIVRTGTWSDTIPASILQTGPAPHRDKVKQRNSNAAHDAVFPPQLRQSKGQVGSQQHATRNTLEQNSSRSSRDPHDLGQTGFVQDELDVRTVHRPRDEPRFAEFQSMSSDFRAEQRPKNRAVSRDESRTIREGQLTKRSIRKDRELQSGNVTDDGITPRAGLTVHSTAKERLTGNRAATDQTSPTSNGAALPCEPEPNLGPRLNIGGSSSQAQQTTVPLHAGNLLQYNPALDFMLDVHRFPPHSGVASHIPLLCIDQRQGVGQNVPASACAEIPTGLRSREAMMRPHIMGNTCSSATHLLMNAGYNELVHDLDISRYAHGGEAPNLEISHQQENAHVSSGTLPYDAPITDFEISHGGFDGKVDVSDDASKPSDARMHITHQDALSHLSEADLVTTRKQKKPRGRPETGAGDDALRSRWRQKRRKTNDIASSCGKDDKSRAEQMKLQRALRNRESAKRSRIKSKVQFQNMERKYAELTDENVALTTLIGDLLPPCMDLIPKDAKEALELATNPPP